MVKAPFIKLWTTGGKRGRYLAPPRDYVSLRGTVLWLHERGGIQALKPTRACSVSASMLFSHRLSTAGDISEIEIQGPRHEGCQSKTWADILAEARYNSKYAAIDYWCSPLQRERRSVLQRLGHLTITVHMTDT